MGLLTELLNGYESEIRDEPDLYIYKSSIFSALQGCSYCQFSTDYASFLMVEPTIKTTAG